MDHIDKTIGDLENLIAIGDLHIIKKEPYRSQVIDIINWFCDSEYNNEKNALIFLGDLTEEVETPHALLGILIDFIINRIKCREIIILQGNHDCNIEDTLLSTLAPLPRVKVISKWEAMTIGTLKCLLLPFYYHESTKLDPMHIAYSNLPLENESFDYVFHHIEDETQAFGDRANLEYIKANSYLCGHIHTEDKTRGGHYLGSPGFNSFSENDKTPYIASISMKSKEYTLIKVPRFISYHEVTYPEPLPDKKDTKKYPIFLVKDSLDKAETLRYYEEEAKKKGYTFHTRKVCRKRTVSDIELETISSEEDKSDEEWFEIYSKEKGLDSNTEVLSLCLQIFQKRKSA